MTVIVKYAAGHWKPDVAIFADVASALPHIADMLDARAPDVVVEIRPAVMGTPR